MVLTCAGTPHILAKVQLHVQKASHKTLTLITELHHGYTSRTHAMPEMGVEPTTKGYLTLPR